MSKRFIIACVAAALSLAAWSLAPTPGGQVSAQSGPFYINAVDIDVVRARSMRTWRL